MKISNLKVNSLKKLKYKILPVAVAGIIVTGLSSCVPKYNAEITKDYSYSTNSQSVTNAYDYSYEEPSYVPSVTLEDYNLEELTVKFNSSEIEDITKFISNIQVEYKDSELYNVDEALDTYSQMEPVDSTSNSIISNNHINSDLFYQLVLTNNNSFLSLDKTNKYNNINNTKLKEIVDIISNHLNNLLQESTDIDANKLDENLKQLKILEFKSFGNAFVDMDDPMLCLNFTAIDSLQQQNRDINMLQRVIEHESSHLIQVSYPKEDEFEYNMGISYSYDNLKVNSLYWQWFVEASAEKLSLKTVSDNPFNYVDQVRGLESLILANITNITQVDEIEKLSLQKDLNKLFELCNATTPEEKREIVNMMFAYDIIFTENDEFLEYYKETKGEMDLLSLYDYKDELKPSIATTLTKMFYTNLANSLTTNESSLSDVYILMRTFETEMCRLTDYDNPTKDQINSSFIDNYDNIQNEFFTLLSAKTSIEASKLKDLYYLYSEEYRNSAKFKTEDNYQIDVNVDWLSEEQNEFLEHTSKSRIYHINQNINIKQ